MESSESVISLYSTDSQPLLGVSLDSVVQKAEDLSSIIQACKNSLENQSSPRSWGRDSTTNLLSLPASRRGSRSDFPVPCPAQPMSAVSSNPGLSKEALLEQWKKLTSYIVSLEKEVQCYKQLIEECQQAGQQVQVTSSGSDLASETEHAQYSQEEQLHPGDRTAAAAHSRKIKKRSSARDQKYWDKLLEEDRTSRALLLVFSYLSTHELCAVSRVCRKWHTLSKHPLLWRSVAITETVLQPQVLLRLSRLCTSTEKLTLHGLMPPMTEHDEDLSSYISRTRGSLENAVEVILVNSSDTLVSLTLTECNLMITERVLWLISIHCPNLKSLSYCSDEFPPSQESLWSLTNGCRNIQHLHIPPVLGSPNEQCFNDSALGVIACGWPSLASLTVGGKTITTEGLAAVAQGCPNLCFLEIIHGPDFDKSAVDLLCQNNRLSSLTTLILNFTPSTHVALSHLLGHCLQLQRIDLHVTLQSYFTTETNNPDNIFAYEKIIRNLKNLEKNKRGRNVFHLFEHNSRS